MSPARLESVLNQYGSQVGPALGDPASPSRSFQDELPGGCIDDAPDDLHHEMLNLGRLVELELRNQGG